MIKKGQIGDQIQDTIKEPDRLIQKLLASGTW
jgi:hypothetical protein